MMGPRTFNTLAGVALQAFAVDIGEDIEATVGVADARCPDSLSIDFLVVLQREGFVIKIETVKAVTDVLPVHEVLGVEDDQSWHSVHRGSGEVVVVAHPKDIRVGKLVVEQGIREGAVAVVCCPRLGLCTEG